MGELFFIAKSIFLTVVVIVVFQVKVGDTTLEEKTLHWIESSPAVVPIQEAASGGVKAIRESWKILFGHLNSKFFNSVEQKNTPGKRDLHLTLARSEDYLREQARKLKAKAEEAALEAKKKYQNSNTE